MVAEIETKIKFEKTTQTKIHSIILLIDWQNVFSTQKMFNENVCGKKMQEYLNNACFSFKRTKIEIDDEKNILPLIKAKLDSSEITLILFSDTPLISSQTLMSYIDKLLFSNDNFIAMPRGFVFKTEHLKTINCLPKQSSNPFEKNEFLQVKNFVDLENVCKILQNKILNFHMLNGVKIIDKQTTKIDADVDIFKGTTVLPFSQILGFSVIGENCTISNATLISCKVADGCKVELCHLENCEIGSKTVVNPFTFAKDKVFKRGTKC